MIESNLRVTIILICSVLGIIAIMAFRYPEAWMIYNIVIIVICVVAIIWQIAKLTK